MYGIYRRSFRNNQSISRVSRRRVRRPAFRVQVPIRRRRGIIGAIPALRRMVRRR